MLSPDSDMGNYIGNQKLNIRSGFGFPERIC